MRERDPITLRPVKVPFRVYHGPNACVLFDARSLFEYVRTTGDVTCPVTRKKFQTHDLMRLARLNHEKHDVITQERHPREVARRQLLMYLEDEFMTELQQPVVNLAVLAEVLGNIQGTVLTPHEEHTSFRRIGALRSPILSLIDMREVRTRLAIM